MRRQKARGKDAQQGGEHSRADVGVTGRKGHQGNFTPSSDREDGKRLNRLSITSQWQEQQPRVSASVEDTEPLPLTHALPPWKHKDDMIETDNTGRSSPVAFSRHVDSGAGGGSTGSSHKKRRGDGAMPGNNKFDQASFYKVVPLSKIDNKPFASTGPPSCNTAARPLRSS